MRETTSAPSAALHTTFLTRKELAQRWRCSISTLKRKDASGVLKPVQVGPRIVRYRLEEVEALEAAQTKTA